MQFIVKVSIGAVPLATVRQVEVPGENRPFVRSSRIPVEIPVLAMHIGIPNNAIRGAHIDTHGNVHIVIGEIQKGAT